MSTVIGVLGDPKNDYQRLQEQELREKAAQLGYACRVVFAEHDGAIGQIHHIFAECLNKSGGDCPDILIIEPMKREGVETALGKAMMGKTDPTTRQVIRKPVLVGVINQQLSPAVVPTVFITSDPLATGSLQAKQCRSILRDGGKVLVIAGPDGIKVTQGRLEGLQKGLEGSNINIVHIAYMSSWNGDEIGRKNIWEAMGRLKRQNLSFDLIACQNDALAMTALTILDELHRDDVPVIGVDGTPMVGRAAVDQRKLKATIITPPGGGPALEQIHQCLQGRAYNPHVELEPISYPKILAA